MQTQIIEDTKQKMQMSLDSLQHNLNGLRTGRASVTLLEPIHIDAYGARMSLSQVATISAPESSMLAVQVWDNGLVSPVEKAIQTCGLGLNPITEGNSIRIPIPPLSQERRKELAKKAKEYNEQIKVAVRNIRRAAIDQLKKLEKDGEISEDELHSVSDNVQKITDEYTRKIDSITDAKEKEIITF